MRVLSFFLALFLHVLAGLAFLGVSFAPKIHVDLNSRVYDVVLVNLPREKKIPDPVKQPPAVKKVEPVKQAPAARPKKKEVAAKPVKPQPRAVPNLSRTLGADDAQDIQDLLQHWQQTAKR